MIDQSSNELHNQQLWYKKYFLQWCQIKNINSLDSCRLSALDYVFWYCIFKKKPSVKHALHTNQVWISNSSCKRLHLAILNKVLLHTTGTAGILIWKHYLKIYCVRPLNTYIGFGWNISLWSAGKSWFCSYGRLFVPCWTSPPNHLWFLS